MQIKLTKRSRLMILGIVATSNAVGRKNTAYSVARALGLSHVTARKRLKILTANGLLDATVHETSQGFGRVEYKLSNSGLEHLSHNSESYVHFLQDIFPF